ncbi:hypothetical protein DRQ33_03720 [bacterium]|nr:MAG: hypothetical protein DRQ33_03720 [bacterium]
MGVFSISDGSLIDIILYFAEQAEKGDETGSPNEIRKELITKGYKPVQIDSAFSLFKRKVKDRVSLGSVRIFSEEELENFSDDAKALLIRLHRLGLLSPEQTELILMRVSLLSETEFSLEELKIMVAMMLNQPPYKHLPTGFFVPNDREDDIEN